MFGRIGHAPLDIGQQVLHDTRPDNHAIVLVGLTTTHTILDRQSSNQTRCTGIVVFDLHGKGHDNGPIPGMNGIGRNSQTFRQGPERQIEIAFAKEGKGIVGIQMVHGDNWDFTGIGAPAGDSVGLSESNFGGTSLGDEHMTGKGNAGPRRLFQVTQQEDYLAQGGIDLRPWNANGHCRWGVALVIVAGIVIGGIR